MQQPAGNVDLIRALQNAEDRSGQREVIRQLDRCQQVLLMSPAGDDVAVAPFEGWVAVYAWTSEAALRAFAGNHGQQRPTRGSVVLSRTIRDGAGLWIDPGQDHALLVEPAALKALAGEAAVSPIPSQLPAITAPSVVLGPQQREHMANIASTTPHLREAWLVDAVQAGVHHVTAVVVGLGTEDHQVVQAVMSLVLEPLDRSREPSVIPAPQPNDPTLLHRARQVGTRLV